MKGSLILILTLLICCENCYSQKNLKKNTITKVSKQKKKTPKLIIPYRPIGLINDYEKILTSKEIDNLDSIILKFEKETSIEILIISLDERFTTKEYFDSTILMVHNNWGVGKYKKNNGILIGISSELRKIRISNGDGVREKLSDEKTKIIIDEIIIPQFKENKYYLGFLNGLTEIINILK